MVIKLKCATSLHIRLFRFKDKLSPKRGEPESAQVLFSLLGLLINLSQKTSEQLDHHAHKLLTSCTILMTCDALNVQERSFVVTSLILQHSQSAKERHGDKAIIERSIDVLNVSILITSAHDYGHIFVNNY